MKNLLFFTFFSFCMVSFSQTIIKNQLSELPRTADDFRSYRFDYNLESVIEIGTPYTDIMYSNLNILGHSPLEHNCPVRSISFKAYDSTVRFGENRMNKEPSFIFWIKFSDSGEILAYHRGWGSEAVVLRPQLVPCVPNAYIIESLAVKSNGQITQVKALDNHAVEYEYDSEKRVVQATIREYDKCVCVYRYSYNSGNNNIKQILGYDGKGRMTCDITYVYTNNKLSTISCLTYGYTLNGNKYMGDKYSKSYRYDTHNNISEITWMMTERGISWYKQRLVCENNYNAQGRISTSKVSLYFSNKNQLKETCRSHTRKYTYDDRGNWIRIEEDNGTCAIREIEY